MHGLGGDYGTAEKSCRHRRFFTVAQANSALVLIKRIVADIVSDYNRLLDLQEMLDIACQAGSESQTWKVRDQITSTVKRVQSCADELDDVGVDLEDWTIGAVSFPCIAGGKQVALSWQAGQDEVMFWHEIDAELIERKSLDTLPVEQTAIV